MSSSVSPGAKFAGECHANVTWRSFANGSSTVIVCDGTTGAGTTTTLGFVLGGKLPNHFCTSCLATAGSKSPTSASVAFDGTYHVLKKLLTSSTDAATRSSCLPIVM